MKNFTFKTVALLTLSLMLLSIFCVPVMAAVNSEEKVILKKSDKEFLIYYKDILAEEFEFAFSSNKEEQEANLNFTKSAKDQAENSTSNIAYIDETLYDTYFKDNKQAYIWIRNNSDEIVIKADLIKLEEALTDEQVELVNTTTKRIDVDTSKTSKTNEVIDGVDTTITRGKIVISGKDNAKYSYMILEATDETSNASKLYSLAEQVENATDTYEKLKLSKEFNELYTKLLPEDKEWQKVENLEIMQPEDAQKGDKYVVFIKEDLNKDTTIDAKFMVSVRTEEQGKNQIEEEVTEVVQSPVTFDSGMILFIVLAVIIVLLVIFLVIRKKQNKEEN